MHCLVTMERCHDVPERLTGKGHRGYNEWIVCVRVIRTVWDDEDHLMKFFFDNENEARWYKEDIEKLIGLTLSNEHERIEKKFKSWLLSHDR